MESGPNQLYIVVGMVCPMWGKQFCREDSKMFVLDLLDLKQSMEQLEGLREFPMEVLREASILLEGLEKRLVVEFAMQAKRPLSTTSCAYRTGKMQTGSQ